MTYGLSTSMLLFTTSLKVRPAVGAHTHARTHTPLLRLTLAKIILVAVLSPTLGLPEEPTLVCTTPLAEAQ